MTFYVQAPAKAFQQFNDHHSEKPKLLDQVRNVIRCKHYSIRTEQSYVEWIRRYIFFHECKHPKDLAEKHISAFLTHLAVERKVASSTQNQALCAIIFLYREVIKKEIGELDQFVRAKRPSKLPIVFTRDEVRKLLLRLTGTQWIMGQLLYGSGLRLMECLRLRVKDIDFGYNQIVVRDGKSHKDRVTMLPGILIDPLKRHLAKVQQIHQQDLDAGFGTVYLPYALERKYRNANRSWGWQHVFPSSRRSIDPRSGIERRHHASEKMLHRAIKKPSERAASSNPAVATHYDTASLLICSKPAMISAPCRSFWVIKTSLRR